MKQRLAPVLASVFALMSCELAQAQALQINTGYAPGYWYRNPLGSAGAAGSAYGSSGRVTCTPYYVSGPSGMRASAVGATLTTTDASNYVSFAIYSASGNFPGSLVDSTPAQKLATAGGVSGSLAKGTDTLAPGGYFLCAASNSTTAVLVGVSNSGTSTESSTMGSSTLAGAVTQIAYTAVTCSGGASGCGPAWAAGGGSSYTWPSSLASAKWSAATGLSVPLMALQSSASSAAPPPQAVSAGYSNVIFNSDFSTAPLSTQVSCYNGSFTTPWSQGLWWETINNCNNISIVNDSVFGKNVLDLAWTLTGNPGAAWSDTTIETFPYPYGKTGVVPAHFSYQYGYFEAVMRMSTAATGVWPAIWLLGDTTNTQDYTAPGWTSSVNNQEFDVFEGYGGWAGGAPGATAGDAAVHEWYAPGSGHTGQITAYSPWSGIISLDITQPHTYGWLWTPAIVCSYIDNVLEGCVATDSVMDSQPVFPLLTMQIGCGSPIVVGNTSCIGGLTRADMYVSRVTVFQGNGPVTSPVGVPPSADGTTIPAGAARGVIVDGAYNVYIINASNQIAELGIADTNSNSVSLALFKGGVLYYETTWGGWYGRISKNKFGLMGTGDPRISFTGSMATLGGGSLKDSSANVWTITSGGVVAENGVNNPNTSNALFILYYGGTVYYKNTSGTWHSWSGTTWRSLTGDPRIVSGNGMSAMASSSSSIVDGSENVWLVTGLNQVVRNGVVDTSAPNASQVMYVNGTVYHQNSMNDDWYSWGGSSWTSIGGQNPLLTARFGGSPNGLVVTPSSGTITDASSDTWTVDGSDQVVENSTPFTGNSSVTEALWFDGNIYIYAGGAWYSHLGGEYSWTWNWLSGDPRVASASGTVITNGKGYIVDASNNVFVVNGTYVDINGVPSQNYPTSMLWYSGTVYMYQNASGGVWYSWGGGTTWNWLGPTDPRTTSSSGSTATAGSGIIVDGSHNIWAITNNCVVTLNAAPDTNTSNVSLVLYYGGTVYYETVSSQWYSWSRTAWVPISGDPR